MVKLLLCYRVDSSLPLIVTLAISFLLSDHCCCGNIWDGGKVDQGHSLSSSEAPVIVQSQSRSESDEQVEINYLHIYSNIRFRYSRTRVLTKLTNHGSTPVSASYYFKIPKDQFVTEFTIEKNQIAFKGRAEIMDDVEKYINRSNPNRHRHNATLGVIQLYENQTSSDFDTYKMTISLWRKQEVSVTFVYEGLVDKISGHHILLKYELNVKPEEVSRVKSYKVKVNIMESKLSPPQLPNIRGKRNVDKLIPVLQKPVKVGEDNWEISWSPDDAALKELIAEDVLGEVDVLYNTQLNSEDQVVLVRDGYLAYLDDWSFMRPNRIVPFHEILLPLHVIFILDVSGSMEGRRLEMLKLGMTKILNLMKLTSNYKDIPNFIDIVTFSNKIEVWAPLGKTNDLYPLNAIIKNIALNYIHNLKAGGSTNIYAALQEGLRLANRARNFDLEPKSIIFFVTDGEPTSGLIDIDQIRKRVKNVNGNSFIPIFSLAFGSEADFGFCRNISSDTRGGLARKIFDLDKEDAAESFEMFYRQIASPSLQNMTFVYTTPIHYVKEVTHRDMVTAQVSSTKGKQKFHGIKFDATTYEIPCAEHCLMERIFALRKIKKLYKMRSNQTLVKGYCSRAQLERRRSGLTSIREANNLARKHNFITPCTSLVAQEVKAAH